MNDMNGTMEHSMPMDSAGMEHVMGDMGMGMGHMDMGPMVWGMSSGVLLMMVSGIFYLICALIIWKPYRREKSELLGALFAFLLYQAVSMFFMGLEMKNMNMLYGNISGFAVLIGTAYMLKFPLSSLSAKTRRISFMVILIAALATFVWFMQTDARQMQLMHFVLWFDLVANGIVVGGSILLFGLKAREKAIRSKAIGGAAGVATCCIAANGAMIAGYMLTSSFFGFLAPILILLSLNLSKKSSASVPTTGSVTPASGAIA